MDEHLNQRLNPKRSLPKSFRQRLKRNRGKKTSPRSLAPEKLQHPFLLGFEGLLRSLVKSSQGVAIHFKMMLLTPALRI
jgi:hypothetical protein